MAGNRPRSGPTTWLVEYHSEAIEEYNALRDSKQRKGVLTIVDILRQVGPKVTEPHMKPVQGSNKLRELRPGGGKTLVRPLYFRFDERRSRSWRSRQRRSSIARDSRAPWIEPRPAPSAITASSYSPKLGGR